MVIATLILGATLRVFGSAGVEAQLTPANEASPLNPGNAARIPVQTNVADFSVFAEAAPESRKWKVRMKVRGDASDRAAEHLLLGEAYAQFRVTPWLDVTAGRVIEKWGTGYGWTPTAFAGPSRNPTDPNDRRSQNAGIDMLRADLFVLDTSVALYALRDGDFAARGYRLVGGTDVSLAWRRDRDGNRIGLSLSRVIGESLEVHAEGALRRDDGNATSQAVAGAQYTVRNTNIIVEVYHGTDGLTRAEWTAFHDGAIDALQRGDRDALIAANREFSPLRMARTYSFVRLFHDLPRWKTDAELIAITNLQDQSTIVRATLSRRVRPSLSAYLIATEFVGHRGSEMSLVQIERAATVGVRAHF